MKMPQHRAPRFVILFTLIAPMVIAGWGISVARAQDKAEISMWFDTTGGSETADCMVLNAVDTFNEGNETVEVKATLQANGWDATRTALAGGAGPDVVTTPGPSFAVELAKAGQLLALDEIASANGWSETFIPWALDLGKVDGKLYSVPTEVETLVLYYNATLFEENGWTPPTTMDEMMTLAQQVDDAGIIPFAHANAEWRPANEWFVGEFLNHGAGPQKVYEALTGAAKWTDPEFVTAIESLNQMQQNSWFLGGLDRYYTATFAEALAAFGDGDAAMKIEGTWVIGDFVQYFGDEAGNENDWGWVPVPSTDGQASYTLGIGSTFSINKNTDHPEAVADFITHLFSPEVQATLAVECGLAPAPVTIAPEALSELDSRYAEILTGLNEAATANNYGYTTWTFWPPKTETYLIENIEKVWAGDMTVDEYLAGMQTIFDQEKAEGTIPPIPAR